MHLDEHLWQQRLTALAEKNGVVGASLALAVGDELVVAATGVLNRRTMQPATPDSVFHLGSITKAWTATLAMQLVDEGSLDLDEPVRRYLPELRLADDDLAARVTTRHLLTHTSGIAGDFFPDTGRGDDCLARFVELMAELPADHPLGATMSYCNAGFTLLGRLVEVLRGRTWDTVLRERLIAPLALEAVGSLPEEALLWGAAVGHLHVPGAPEPMVAPQWGMSRNAGPTGAIHGRARDLVAFAAMHMRDGMSPDEASLLTPESARLMRTPQAQVPDPHTLGDAVGLAWMLWNWGGQQVVGHDGATIGQNSFLRFVPEVGLSYALLTNGGEMRELHHELLTEVFDAVAGIAVPPSLEPAVTAVDTGSTDVVGRYSRQSMDIEIEQRGDELLLVSRPTGALALAMGTDRIEAPLLPYDGRTYLTRLPAVAGWLPVVFYETEGGDRYLHLGGRASRRVG